MGANEHGAERHASGLLGWLGLGARGADDAAAPGSSLRAAVDSDTARALARQQRLGEIDAFLGRHNLDLTTQTLSVAHDYLTGGDPGLCRQIDRQVLAHQPLTPEFLDEISDRGDRGDDLAMLTQLMQRLEASIDEFGATSRDAQRATSAYHSALEDHVSELEQVTSAGAVISELANIAKVMIKRTREIEKQMLRSEAQTRSLKRRLEETKRSAEEDHLTGLPNRRAFEARFEEEYREARAAAEPLCVAFCDIDHFKRINDTHGHDAGDRVLKLVADSLARISDDRCHVARHGGEEFVVLLRDRTAAASFSLLDKLREALAQRRLVNRATDVPFGQITFSGGIADVFATGDPRSALRAADAALYRAKEAGRNRIEIATAEDAAWVGNPT